MTHNTRVKNISSIIKFAFVFGVLITVFLFFVPHTNAATIVSGIISSDTEWTIENSPYIVSNVTIVGGSTLTIGHGVIIKFTSDSSLIVNGSIHANGTEIDPIYFTSIKDDTVGGDTNGDGTSTSPAPGDWDGILLGGNGSTGINNFFYTDIGFGGASCFNCYRAVVYAYGTGDTSLYGARIHDSKAFGVNINQASGSFVTNYSEFDHTSTVYGLDWNVAAYGISQGTTSISNSNFHDNQSVGVLAQGGALSLVKNQFSNNLSGSVKASSSVNFNHSDNTESGSGRGGIIISGNMTTDQTWTRDLVYVVNGVTVDAGKTLTIDPGVSIKFYGATATLRIAGTLIVNGTEQYPVNITSIKDDAVGGDTNGDGTATVPAPGDGGAITISGSGAFNYSIVRYGGGGGVGSCVSCWPANIFISSGNVTINNSRISDSKYVGVYQQLSTSNLTMASSEIINNYYGYGKRYGISMITGTSFHDNAKAGLWNNDYSQIDPSQVDVRNNWWGSDSGPNPPGTGDKILGIALYEPWLTTAPPPLFSPDTRRLIKVGVVLMESADVPHNSGSFTAQPCKLDETPAKTYESGHSKGYYEDLIYCVKDYYKENAYDSLKFDFTFASDGSWQAVSDESKTEAYYKQKERSHQSGTLISDAISASGIDASLYDIVITVHAGSSSQREVGNDSEKLHLTSQILLPPSGVEKIILAEDDPLGAWVHELGHAIGMLTTPENTAAPDLYKEENAVGAWDVMAKGSWNEGGKNPPNMSSYSKVFLGWLYEDIHPKSDYGEHWIDSLGTSKIGDNVFRYNLQDNVDINAQRYYLLEARKKNDVNAWDSSIPTPSPDTEDLILYYVDTQGMPRYGYETEGGKFPYAMSHTVKIPERTLLPLFNNGGIIGVNGAYKDYANFVEFKASDARTVDGKFQIKSEIIEINKDSFIRGMIGAVVFPTSTFLNEVIKSGSGLRDFIYTDPDTGKTYESVLNEPAVDAINTINQLRQIAFYILVGLGILTLILWLARKGLIGKKTLKLFSLRSLKIALIVSATLTIIAGVAFGAVIIAFEVAVSKQASAVGMEPATVNGYSLANPDISGGVIAGVDLHAYCSDGKHIGMNYETGEFENQVPDSIVSGSNGGAPEWIYVPVDVTGCQYFVSSERNQKYLDEHPDIAAQLADVSDSYELSARYIDPATGIFTSSTQTDQVIQPGIMMKHEVSGTTEIAVTPGVVGTPNEPPPAPPLFCPLLSQSVTYSALPPAPACTFTNGPKTLQLKDSSCNPIAGARVNVRKANGAYLTYALTDANGLADLSGYANPDASYFEIDYHGATYSTDPGTFSTGTGVQTHPYELTLKGSDCAPITGARVNLRKENGAYVTYALTNADGKASFEVVPNASMKLETDYHGGTWMSEARVPDTAVTLGTDKYALVLTDNAGGAISNARINLRKENSAYVTYAMTNESGTASFEVLPNVSLVFEVDYHGATYRTAASATHEESRVSAIPFGAQLLDSNGTPISGARVNLRKSNDAYVTYALTDADGAAVFQVVPGAQMKLEVDYHGATYLTGTLDAATSPSVTIQSKAFGLRLINNAGDPISGARVNLRKANGAYVTYALTNADGRASFEVVPGAQMKLEVDYRGGAYQTEVATVSGDMTLQVQTSPITVHLTAQGQPLANTRTDLLKENGAYVTYGMTGVAGDVAFEVLPNTFNKVRAAYNGTSWVSDAVTGGSVVAKDF